MDEEIERHPTLQLKEMMLQILKALAMVFPSPGMLQNVLECESSTFPVRVQLVTAIPWFGLSPVLENQVLYSSGIFRGFSVRT